MGENQRKTGSLKRLVTLDLSSRLFKEKKEDINYQYQESKGAFVQIPKTLTGMHMNNFILLNSVS